MSSLGPAGMDSLHKTHADLGQREDIRGMDFAVKLYRLVSHLFKHRTTADHIERIEDAGKPSPSLSTYHSISEVLQHGFHR